MKVEEEKQHLSSVNLPREFNRDERIAICSSEIPFNVVRRIDREYEGKFR